MQKFFSELAEVLNNSERAVIDLLSAFVPYMVPVIPAYLTYFHTLELMKFPAWVAFTAAFVVETLGMASVSTTIRFWRNNQRYKSEANKAPFGLALSIYVMYLVIVLTVNVVLEMVSGERSGWIIFSIGLFSLLSVPSGVLISIRAQFTEMLSERAEAKQATKNPPALVRAFASETSAADGIEFTGERGQRFERVCKCGCGKSFTTSHTDKMYFNKAHKQKHYRELGKA